MSVSLLERRRIEAAFAGRIFKAMEAEIGRPQALAILEKAVVEAARQAGAEAAARTGAASDLTAFAEVVALWRQDDALAIDWLKVEPAHLDFNVTRCRYAETYRELGVEDIGGALSCNRDGAFCTGFNPGIRMCRTQTIMEGAAYCDFRFSLSAEPDEGE